MKVSLNIIKQFINFDLPPVDDLVGCINQQLGGVEEVIDLDAKYKDAKIVKVVECEKHPNADKLSVCKVDAGTGELVQIVCGANNVHADMWAVWLPPGSTVPATFDDADPFVLGARELRGMMSNGMLASARELAIGDDHDGIVDITEADVPKGKALEVGASFAEVFSLNDTIIDIENKMFTHRPDLFGQLGVAREIAGILGHQFTSPEWYTKMPENTSVKDSILNGDGLELSVFNEAPEGSPRLMAVALKDIEVKPSPLWLQCALVAMGSKPINNIVDATNYIMLITAQPTHAYDYDKLRGKKLGVRMAKDGEKLPLLNGKTYKLTSDDIVIADGEGAIGLAGIMGGGNSEVSADTKNIVLEVANFNMYAVRKSSMRHGLFTDALTRFNKGQSPLQTPAVMAALLELVDGQQASQVFDVGENNSLKDIKVTGEFINQRLGLSLVDSETYELLSNVEIKVDILGDGQLEIMPPFWRTDLELPEDIVEEIGRLYGYDKLPRELPMRSAKPVAVNDQLALKRQLRSSLARAGANEVLTYSFVHARIIEAAGQNIKDAYQLSNALSPELQFYRLSLIPSLLDRIHPNIKSGHDEFSLFEIGKIHDKKLGLDEAGLPPEPGKLALVYASKNAKDGAAFYRVKNLLTFIADQLGLKLDYEGLSVDSTDSVAAPFEPKRSAIVVDSITRQQVGVIGEFKKSATRNFKLPDYAAGLELDSQVILELSKAAPTSYRPLSRFPSVGRDVSLRVAANTRYSQVRSELDNSLSQTELDYEVRFIGVYQPEDADFKNITFHISLASQSRTLVNSEVNDVMDRLAIQLKSSIGAEIV